MLVAVTSLGLSIALAPGSDATTSERQSVAEMRLAQTRPDASGVAPDNLRGVGLTASHKRIIFDHIGTEPAQTVPNDTELAVGNTIPDPVLLTTVPIAAKDQIGLL